MTEKINMKKYEGVSDNLGRFKGLLLGTIMTYGVDEAMDKAVSEEGLRHLSINEVITAVETLAAKVEEVKNEKAKG